MLQSTQSTQSSQSSKSSSQNTQKKKKYTLQFKRRVIRRAEVINSKRQTAKEFGLERSTVRRWIRNKKAIEETHYQKMRHRVKNKRRPFFAALEVELSNLIKERRSRGAVVTGTYIVTQARIIAETRQLENFQASRGWLSNFLNRHDLVLRRITSKGKQLPLRVKEIINEFHVMCERKRAGLSRQQIYNMDETNIELDCPGNYTYENKGTKNVHGMTTGHEKVKISFAVCCSADVDVLPLTVIIPRATPLPNFQPPDNIHVVYKPNSKTFDTEVLQEHFIDGVFFPHMLRKGQKKSLLFLDHAPCHLTSPFQIAALRRNINLEFIPARMTQLLQPADVSWIRFIKSEYLRLWQDWFINSEKSFTRFGNMRSPGYVQIITWLSQIMKNLSTNKEIIVNSFNITGITQSDPERFNSALKHVLQTNETQVTIVDDLDGTEDLAETFLDDEELEFVEDTEDEDQSSKSSGESTDESVTVESVPMNQFSANNSLQSTSQTSTQLLTETEEDISIIKEHRCQQKRKNSSNENVESKKKTRIESAKKRKRDCSGDETPDREIEEPRKKKALNDSTNANAPCTSSSTMQTRSQKKN